MIPRAKIDALLKAPPRKLFRYPSIPPELRDGSKRLAFIPGRTIKDPSLKIIRNPIVFRILILRSSIEKIFFIV
jgi:hypothetical protein